MSPAYRPVVERFWEKVSTRRVRGNECWEWTGCHSSAGYGQLWNGERMDYAHRISHELFIGPIPQKYHVDHLCRNRGCVNPRHLEAVTNSVNVTRGWAASAHERTHCRNGHEKTPENIYHYPPSAPKCRICHNEGAKRLRRERRAA